MQMLMGLQAWSEPNYATSNGPKYFHWHHYMYEAGTWADDDGGQHGRSIRQSEIRINIVSWESVHCQTNRLGVVAQSDGLSDKE